MLKSSLAVVEVTRSLSDVIKSNFVLFSDQKKMIKTIDSNNPKVLQSSVKAVDTGYQFESLESEQDQVVSDDPDLSVTTGQIPKDKHQSDDYESDILSGERFNDRFEDGYQVGYNQGFETGFQEAAEKGYEEGYQNGTLTAQNEFQDKFNALESELQVKYDRMQSDLRSELEAERNSLEPQMLSLIERLVHKIIGVESLNQNTILFLIKAGLSEIELHGDLIIKVSHEDIDYVIENKAFLSENLSEKINIEILKDLQLEKNECVIETDMGTIDCSLGTQMEALMKELRLIRDSLMNP